MTSPANKEDIASVKENIVNYENSILMSALNKYKSGIPEQSSVFPTDTTDNSTLSIDTINTLANGINTNLSNLRTANSYIMSMVLTNGLMGKAYECINSNINTDYKLNYCLNLDEEDIDEDKLNEAKLKIKEFNEKIDIENLIREATSGTFLEGNYPMYMRLAEKGDTLSVVIDHYPLSFCYPSDYKINGMSVLECNIDDLKARLQKTYQKGKKTRKAIYYENILKEIQANYPTEVYKAYNDKETYVKLDINNSACPRINTMGRKFGISPFFKCLKPALVLDNIENADVASSKSRSKKIIFQKLRQELMGVNGDRKGLVEQLHAHESAASALKTNFCLYTAPPYVESLEYIIDKSTAEDSSNQIKIYTSQLLTALGINFTDSEISSFTTATISVEQLMRIINSITTQIESALEKFYKVFLVTIGLEEKYAPCISIVDSEMMEWNLRKEFASFAYGTLNVSRETAFELVGLDIQDEKQRREKENSENYDDIFSPRATAFNSGVDTNASQQNISTRGRPQSSKNTEEQGLDKAYTEVKNSKK